MAAQWYYQVRGDACSLVMGPVGFDVLRRLAQQGYLTRDALVREGEEGDWLGVTSIGELARAVSQAERRNKGRATQPNRDWVPPSSPPSTSRPAPAASTVQPASQPQESFRSKKAARFWSAASKVLWGLCIGVFLGFGAGLLTGWVQFTPPAEGPLSGPPGSLPEPPEVNPQLASLTKEAVDRFGVFVAEEVRRIRALADREYRLEDANGDQGMFQLEFYHKVDYDCLPRNSLRVPVVGEILLKWRRLITYFGRAGETCVTQLWRDLKVECSYRDGAWQRDTDVAEFLGIKNQLAPPPKEIESRHDPEKFDETPATDEPGGSDRGDESDKTEEADEAGRLGNLPHEQTITFTHNST